MIGKWLETGALCSCARRRFSEWIWESVNHFVAQSIDYLMTFYLPLVHSFPSVSALFYANSPLQSSQLLKQSISGSWG